MLVDSPICHHPLCHRRVCHRSVSLTALSVTTLSVTTASVTTVSVTTVSMTAISATAVSVLLHYSSAMGLIALVEIQIVSLLFSGHVSLCPSQGPDCFLTLFGDTVSFCSALQESVHLLFDNSWPRLVEMALLRETRRR